MKYVIILNIFLQHIKLFKKILYNNITMTTLEDYDIDERAENDNETFIELEQERKWRVISKFKEFISKEPEFSNINNLSSQKILEIIETTTSNKNNNEYPIWQLVFIAELLEEVQDISYDLNHVKNVYYNIYFSIN